MFKPKNVFVLESSIPYLKGLTQKSNCILLYTFLSLMHLNDSKHNHFINKVMLSCQHLMLK